MDSDSIFLRDIPVSVQNRWWNYFAIIRLNLSNREADKLVTISRDRLLPQGEDWWRETIEGLLTTFVRLTHEHLLKQYQQTQDKDAKKNMLDQYCALCLLNWNLPHPIEVDLRPLADELVVSGYYTNKYYNKQKKAIHFNQVFDSTEIVIVNTNSYDPSKNAKCIKDNDIITDSDSIIPDRYICSEVFFMKNKNGNDIECYRLIKSDSKSIKRVSISDDDIKRIRIQIYSYNYINYNYFSCLHGFSNDRYTEIVVGKDAPLLGCNKPYYGNCWIYPIKGDIKEALPNHRTEAEKWLLEEGRMKELVPDYIVKLIMKHNILGKDYPTNDEDFKKYREEIYQAYIRLILDNRFGVKKTS